MSDLDLKNEMATAAQERKANKKLAQKLKKKTPKDLDRTVSGLHEETFESIDCLTCANCCKTTSPIFRDVDIERLSKHLRMKPVAFIQQYLYLDQDGHYVLHEAPCAFLGEDNICSVYAHRPQACREYPHTDRKRFHQILDLSVRNTEVCPAVRRIFERLREHY